MSRMFARNVGVLAVLATLMTSSTVAFAAAPSDDLALHLSKKKKATTLVELSPELQQRTVETARATPHATKLSAPGEAPQTTGVSDTELDLICGDWFIMWEEDADGDPILGTFTLDCGGTEIPLP